MSKEQNKGKTVVGSISAIIAFIAAIIALLIAIPRGIEAWQKPIVPAIFVGIMLLATIGASIWVLRAKEASQQQRTIAKFLLVLGIFTSILIIGIGIGIKWQKSQIPQNIDLDLISIEDLPGEIFSFDGNGGYGKIIVKREENEDLDYVFQYDMPINGEGYSGIFFRFEPTIDFTEFAFLQAMISFSDESAICEVYLEGQDGKKSYITLGNNELGVTNPVGMV